MSEKLKIALFGCGKMGMHHITAIGLQNNAEIVAVADPNPNQEKIKQALPKAKVYSSPEELLKEQTPDVVHIVTPPHTHADLANLAINHNANVYVEKPFTLDIESTQKILSLAEQKNVKVCAAHQVLFQDTGREYQKHMDLLGDVVHVESYFSFKTVRGSITPVDQLLDILPHPVYLMLSALDKVKSEDNVELCNVEVHPLGDVHAVFKKGDAKAVLVVTLRGRPIESYLRIVGTNGSINADFVLAGVAKHLGPGASAIAAVLQPFSRARQNIFGTISKIFKMVFKKQKSYAGLGELIGSFYKSIQDNTQPLVSPQDIYNTVDICEKIGEKLKAADEIYQKQAQTVLDQAASQLPAIETGKGTVLVTGGGGFLGRVLVTELRKRGWPVRVISRRIPSPSMQVPGIDYVAGDISEPLPAEYFENVGIIAHLAAETAGGKEEHEKNTINATRNMIEAANTYGIKKFINISSIAVLKPSTQLSGPLNEQSPVDSDNLGRGPYVWGKATAEALVDDLGKKYGISNKTIRLGPLVDFKNFTPPGRLGREVGPLYVAMGSKRSKLSLCDVHTAANVIRSYVEDLDAAPPVLNLVEPEAPTRRKLTELIEDKRKELTIFWIPNPVLKFLSLMLKGALKLKSPGKKPLDLYSAFSAERYDASLAGTVIEKANKA